MQSGLSYGPILNLWYFSVDLLIMVSWLYPCTRLVGSVFDPFPRTDSWRYYCWFKRHACCYFFLGFEGPEFQLCLATSQLWHFEQVTLALLASVSSLIKCRSWKCKPEGVPVKPLAQNLVCSTSSVMFSFWMFFGKKYQSACFNDGHWCYLVGCIGLCNSLPPADLKCTIWYVLTNVHNM